MAAVTAIGSLTVARPLLGVWREEIDAYCGANELAWREDPSNAGREHTRNRLRHDALPALAAAMGRDVRRALWRAAELLRAEDELLSFSSAETREIGAQLDVGVLRELPLALQRRIIHAWLIRLKVGGVGFEEVEAVRSMLDSRTAKVNLPGARHARRRAGRIFCE
jgi:tRNA(Ile)-lysidine synthase